MRRVLAAEDGLLLGHLRFDEGVADAGAYCLPAVLFDDLRHGVGGNQVVDDGRAWELLQVALCHQRADGRRGYRLALLVDDETPIRIAIEGKADVRLLLGDELLQIHEVLWIQRVCLVVREGAVEFEVQLADIQRQVSKYLRDSVATHAVGGVHRDGQRANV